MRLGAWTEEEDRLLCVNAGRWYRVGIELGRSSNACRSRHHFLHREAGTPTCPLPPRRASDIQKRYLLFLHLCIVARRHGYSVVDLIEGVHTQARLYDVTADELVYEAFEASGNL